MKHLKMSIVLLLTVAIFTSCEKETITLPENAEIEAQLSSRPVVEGDSDGDGCIDAQDAHPNSNMSETLIIGDYNTGIANQFVNCGTTMMDQIGDVVSTVSLEYKNGNWDYLHKKFMTKLAQTTYYWRKDRLITSTERSKISSYAWQIKANFNNLVIAYGNPGTLLAGGITVQQLLDGGQTVSDLLESGFSVSDLLASGASISDLVADGANAQDFVGELYQGGLIFYIAPTPIDLNFDGILDNGLVCALEDAPNEIASYDAYAYCNEVEFTVNNIVYNDWYFPNKYELQLMYVNLHRFGCSTNSPDDIDSDLCATRKGDFAASIYWSASDGDRPGTNKSQDFSIGILDDTSVEYRRTVRAIRAF